MVPLFINSPFNSDFQYLKEQTSASVLRLSSLGDFIMLFLSCCCVYWTAFIVEKVSHIVNSGVFCVFFFSSAGLYVALCGVFALLGVDEANNNIQNKLFFFFFSSTQSKALCRWQLIQIKSNRITK